MLSWFGMLATLREDLALVPGAYTGQLITPVAPVLRDPGCLHKHLKKS